MAAQTGIFHTSEPSARGAKSFYGRKGGAVSPPVPGAHRRVPGALEKRDYRQTPWDADHSVFVDDDLRSYPDQWAFLASIESMSPQDIEPAILCATGGAHPLDVTFINEEDFVTPYSAGSYSGK